MVSGICDTLVSDITLNLLLLHPMLQSQSEWRCNENLEIAYYSVASLSILCAMMRKTCKCTEWFLRSGVLFAAFLGHDPIFIAYLCIPIVNETLYPFLLTAYVSTMRPWDRDFADHRSPLNSFHSLTFPSIT